jgi:hypothetical protein
MNRGIWREPDQFKPGRDQIRLTPDATRLMRRAGEDRGTPECFDRSLWIDVDRRDAIDLNAALP